MNPAPRKVNIRSRLVAPVVRVPPPQPPQVVASSLSVNDNNKKAVASGISLFPRPGIVYVTAFRNLKALEPQVNRHDASYYLKHGEWLLTQADIYLVMYVDPQCMDQVAAIRRRVDPDLTKTRLIAWSFPDPGSTDLVSRIESRWKLGFRPARYSADKDTPLFVLLTMEKFQLCQRVIQANEFNMSHVYWIDFGIANCQQNPLPLSTLQKEWLQLPPGRVHVNVCGGGNTMDQNVWKQADDPSTWYSTLRQMTPCGVFGGPVGEMRNFCNAAHNEWIMNSLSTMPALEEAVVARLVLQHRERFNVTFAIYEHLCRAFNPQAVYEAIEGMWPQQDHHREWITNGLAVIQSMVRTPAEMQRVTQQSTRALPRILYPLWTPPPETPTVQVSPLPSTAGTPTVQVATAPRKERQVELWVFFSSPPVMLPSIAMYDRVFVDPSTCPKLAEVHQYFPTNNSVIADERFGRPDQAEWILAYMTQQDVKFGRFALWTHPEVKAALIRTGGCKAVTNATSMALSPSSAEFTWTASQGWRVLHGETSSYSTTTTTKVKNREPPAEVVEDVITPAAARAIKIRSALTDADLNIERKPEDDRCLFVLRATRWTAAQRRTWTRMSRCFRHVCVWLEPLQAEAVAVQAAAHQDVASDKLVCVPPTMVAQFPLTMPDYMTIEPGLAALAASPALTRVVADQGKQIQHVWVIDGVQWSHSAIAMTRTVPPEMDFAATHVAAYKEEPGWYWFGQPLLGDGAPALDQRLKSHLAIFRLSVRALRSLARPRSWSAYRELFVPTACKQDNLLVYTNLRVRIEPSSVPNDPDIVHMQRWGE